MKRYIKNGITILDTEKPDGKRLNTTGVVGVTYYEIYDKFRVEIKVDGKKILIGFFREIEHAKKARKVAEFEKKAGTLDDFLKLRPHGNSSKFLDFWDAAFKKYNLI